MAERDQPLKLVGTRQRVPNKKWITKKSMMQCESVKDRNGVQVGGNSVSGSNVFGCVDTTTIRIRLMVKPTNADYADTLNQFGKEYKMTKITRSMRIEDINNIMSLDLVEVGEYNPNAVYSRIVMNRYNEIVQMDEKAVNIDRYSEGELEIGSIISFSYDDSVEEQFYRVTAIEGAIWENPFGKHTGMYMYDSHREYFRPNSAACPQCGGKNTCDAHARDEAHTVYGNIGLFGCHDCREVVGSC